MSFNFKGKNSYPWRELNYLKVKDWLKEINKTSICLDLGCGPMTNKELFTNHSNTIYMDGAKFNNVQIVCNFETIIPLKKDLVDCILLSNVLEHVFYPEKLLLEINRILKPKGKYLLLVPFFIKLHQEPFDYFRYTKHALNRLLKLSKFENFKIVEMGSKSNIIGNLIKLDIQMKRNKNSLSLLLIKFLQKIMFKVYSLQRRIDGQTVNNIAPQGYSIEVIK